MKLRTKRILRGFRRVDNQQYIPTLVGLSILFIGLLLTLVLSGIVRDQNNRAFADQEYQVSSTITRYLTDRVGQYEQLLIGAGALFDVKKDISREDWNLFAESVKINTNFPALLGIGFTEYVPRASLANHEQQKRDLGYHNYTVRTTTPAHPAYASIILIEPQNEPNLKGIGYDMLSEPMRAEAMKVAAQTASAVLTAPIQLIRDEGDSNRKFGSIMYYPVYSTVQPPVNETDRQNALKGYVYVAFRPQDIFNAIPNRLLAGDVTKVRLSDVTNRPIDMFSSDYRASGQGASFTMTQLFDVANRTWQLKLTAYDNVASRRLTPILILGIGIIISTLVALISYAALLHRIHRIQRLHDKQLQKNKDELLAIASHQLRTPASGVKQYIGMLLQGFMGPMTPDQAEIANKAYQANERQLEIINELLYVAKADAGQLFIDRAEIDLRELVKLCIAEQTDKAKEKKITVELRGRKRVPLLADAQFIRMIVENLISNAIKYSYPDSKILLSITTHGNIVTLFIKDTGVGISKSEQEKLFKKFSRVENPLSRSEGGSGLGLFLAKQLAEAHGGTVRVTSAKGKGSTFMLDLPLKTDDNSNTIALHDGVL